MNWRDVALGSVATLVVTVLGGVGVYYLTRERPRQPAFEQLVYEVPSSLFFHTEKTHLCILSWHVGNVGTAAAQDVEIGLRLDSDSKIIDSSVSMSSGPVGVHEDRLTPGPGFQVRVPNLAPSETAALSILVDTPSTPHPEVGVKSRGSIGTAVPFIGLTQHDQAGVFTIQRLAPALVLVALLLQVVILFALRPRIRAALGRLVPASRSINNTAFLFMHRGLIKEARALLEGGINSGGADAHMLANYALCRALEGDQAVASQMLDAASFWAGEKHERAVVAFCRAVAAFGAGHEETGAEMLTDALRLSRLEIKRYCSFSVHVADLRRTHPVLDRMLKQEGIP